MTRSGVGVESDAALEADEEDVPEERAVDAWAIGVGETAARLRNKSMSG
jgi:hypothetical protein